MTFASRAFLIGLLVSALCVTAVLLITFAVSRIVGKHSVIDTAWGALFAVIAIATFFCSSGHGDAARRWLLLLLPVLWGGRLAIHIARRTIGKPEDPRYQELLAKAPGNPDLYALRMVYLLQGVLAFLISAPIQVGAYQSNALQPTAWIGVALWVVGVFFEGVGDLQMERFRSDPANKGKLIQSGLWRYTRHPNYFGDACVWWGIFLVALASWPVLLTIVCPIGMTLLLTKGSGARILERHMSKREGWDDYAARTSGFIPLPPRKTHAST
ncbi:Steroid 5-alpha reductase family enzyme [Frankineae bacterium MT45]|nr:Steroid 5-alpha reductase family enzyme [Frankineae bacterium MT45]